MDDDRTDPAKLNALLARATDLLGQIDDPALRSALEMARADRANGETSSQQLQRELERVGRRLSSRS